MELISDLWNFAPDWRLKLLLLSIAGMIGIVIWLNLELSKRRMAAGKEGRIKSADYAVLSHFKEPDDLAISARAVNNQYEIPIVFYVLVLAAAVAQTETWLTVLAAWGFVLTRFLHARIMLGDNRVMKRRRMFLRGVYCIFLLLAEFVISLLFFAEL